MSCAVSRDGTSIAYEHAGTGPAVILVGVGLDDGSENAALVPESACSTTLAAAGATVATRSRMRWNARSKLSMR